MESILLCNGKRRKARIEVRDGGRAFIIYLDGTEHRAEVVETAPNVYSLLIDGCSFEAAVSWGAPGEASVSLHDGEYEIVWENALAAAVGDAAPHAHEARLVSPMPGKVARMMAKVGDAVKKGQGVVAVEAMKMENEIRSPRDGVVASLHAAPGQAVERGALLAVVK